MSRKELMELSYDPSGQTTGAMNAALTCRLVKLTLISSRLPLSIQPECQITSLRAVFAYSLFIKNKIYFSSTGGYEGGLMIKQL